MIFSYTRTLVSISFQYDKIYLTFEENQLNYFDELCCFCGDWIEFMRHSSGRNEDEWCRKYVQYRVWFREINCVTCHKISSEIVNEKKNYGKD